MDTIGIVSILEDSLYKDVKSLWKVLEQKYGSVGVQTFSHPHISFQGGKTDSLGQLTRDFQDVVANIGPFVIEVSGFGHFDEEVIYLKVDKTDSLIDISKRINHFVKDHCRDLFEHYMPENWIPHITLAMDDLTEEAFEKAWAELKNSEIEFKQEVHNICAVKWYPDGKIRMVEKYELQSAAPHGEISLRGVVNRIESQ